MIRPKKFGRILLTFFANHAITYIIKHRAQAHALMEISD